MYCAKPSRLPFSAHLPPARYPPSSSITTFLPLSTLLPISHPCCRSCTDSAGWNPPWNPPGCHSRCSRLPVATHPPARFASDLPFAMPPSSGSNVVDIVAKCFVRFDCQGRSRLATVDRLFAAQGFEPPVRLLLYSHISSKGKTRSNQFVKFLFGSLSKRVNTAQSLTHSVVGSRSQDVSNHPPRFLSEPLAPLSIPLAWSSTSSAISHPGAQIILLRLACASGHPGTPPRRLNSHSPSNLPQLQPIPLTLDQIDNLHTEVHAPKPLSRDAFNSPVDPSHSAPGPMTSCTTDHTQSTGSIQSASASTTLGS